MGYTIDSDPVLFFDYIYRTKTWVTHEGCPLSGPGSDPKYCAAFVQHFWDRVNVLGAKSIVIFGCGDCAMWGDDTLDEHFLGIDIHSGILEVARQKQPRANFTTQDLIPPCDLLLIKDVMIHWHDEIISNWLEEAKVVAKNIMVVERDANHQANGKYKGVDRDPHIDSRGYCPIDITKIAMEYTITKIPKFAASVIMVKR